jgi:NifU-like protein involved in Fe-S cluster formation
MMYSESTRRYFNHPSAAGAGSGPHWFRGQAGSRRQGTWVQFDVHAPGGKLIRSARFLAFGCPHVIAVSQWVAEQAPGRAVAAAHLPESVQALQARFEVPVEKLGRLLVVEDAWIAALRAADEAPGSP